MHCNHLSPLAQLIVTNEALQMNQSNLFFSIDYLLQALQQAAFISTFQKGIDRKANRVTSQLERGKVLFESPVTKEYDQSDM